MIIEFFTTYYYMFVQLFHLLYFEVNSPRLRIQIWAVDATVCYIMKELLCSDK